MTLMRLITIKYFNRLTALIQTNQSHSKFCPLSRGTRQGCPLSPLLFAVAIEPLSMEFRSSLLFQGVGRWSEEHRVSLYEDLIYDLCKQSRT